MQSVINNKPGKRKQRKNGRLAWMIGVSIILGAIIFSALSFIEPKVEAADPSKDQIMLWRLVRETNSLPATQTVSVQRIGITVLANLVKVQNTSLSESWIFNLDTRRFWILQYRAQVFAEGSFDDLKKYYEARDNDERARLEGEKKNLNSLDEKSRKQRQTFIEQRLEFIQVEPKRLKALPTGGETQTVAGYTAKPVAVKLGKEILETFWVTDNLPMPTGLRRFLDMIAEIDPTTWKTEAALSKIALRSESDFGGIQRNWEIQNVIPNGVSSNEFLIPANFSKVEFPGGLAPNPHQ